jgi:hypothetical protein
MTTFMTTLEALCRVFPNGLKRVGGSGAIGFQLAFFLLPFFFSLLSSRIKLAYQNLKVSCYFFVSNLVLILFIKDAHGYS